MNPYEFAQKHFGEFKTHGSEIKPKLCPYCKGGSGKDKHTFALNMDKLTYNCKRGSCGESGTFNKLCKDFGEVSERNFEINRPSAPTKTYKKPQTKILPISPQAEEYLAKRKISRATLDKRKIGSDEKGNIVFPYYDCGDLVLVKFRPAKKVEKGERKAWREEGGKPVLWGMEICDPAKPLVITEGEIDALACEEAGIPNAVSVPSGAEDLTWLKTCWTFLEQFKNIILFGDNDGPGREMVQKLIVKLGEYRCAVVNHRYKDANELLYREGPEAVRKAYEEAQEVPINGLLRLSEISPLDISKIVKVKSGIPALDKFISGFLMGQISIWTGKNAGGKSTLLGQLLLEAIDQGFGVCAFSGELPAALFKYWIDLQAAGWINISDGKVDSGIKKKINEWYKDKFFLYDSFGSVKSSDILRIFEYAAKRYDCKVFLIDNLMTTDFSEDERDWYHGQSLFVGKVKEFAHKFDVHVHVVAHPRKTQGKIEKNDVSGTGDITNRTDNLFSVSRVTPEDVKENPMLADCQTIVSLLKHRFTGKQDIDFGLTFEEISKRFTPPTMDQKQYGWNTDPMANLGEEVELPQNFEWGA